MNSLNNLLIIISLFVCSTAYGQWNEIKIPFGYDIEHSIIDYKGNIFIRNTGDLYFFNRATQFWSKIDSFEHFIPLTQDCEFQELTNHDLIFRFEDKYYKFNQALNTFETYFTAQYYRKNLDNQGWAWSRSGSNDKFYLSKNKGLSYEVVNIPANLHFCAFGKIESYNNEYNLTIACCGTDCSLYKFNEAGDFQLIIGVIPDPNVTFFSNPLTGTIFVNKDEYLYRSTNSGASFDTVHINKNGFLYDYRIKFIGNNLILQSTNGFYYSVDDGLHWEQFNPNLDLFYPVSALPGSIGILNSIDTMIAINSKCGLQGNFISTNKGVNWSSDDLKNKVHLPDISKLVTHNNVIYAYTCSDSSILKTNDNGETWSSLLVHNNNVDLKIYDLVINEEELYAVTYRGVFKSYDDGINFTKLPIPEEAFIEDNLYNFVISPSGYIALLINNALSYKSDNAGLTWKSFTYPIYLRNPKIDNEGNIWQLIDQYGFNKYDNQKDQNETIPLFQKTYGFAFEITNNGTFYFTNHDINANERFLYISKDKLKTIKKILLNEEMYGIYTIFSDVNNNIYIHTYDGIYISVDEGESFELYDKSLEIGIDHPLANYSLYFSPDDHIFAFDTYYEHNIYEYYKKLSAFGLMNGTVFSDTSNDCILQAQESKLQGIAVNLTGLSSKKIFTDQDGKFRFRADEGNNSVTTVPPNDLWEACPPTNISILPNQTGSINIDLGLKIKKVCPYLTLDIQTPIMRRCFDNNIYIKYCNEGTETSFNAQLKITLPDKMEFLSSTLNPGSINNGELNFDLGDLEIGECGQIIITAKLTCDAQIDELICIYGELSPNYSCSSELFDYSDVRKCAKTTGSFDPNDKTAYINGKPANGISDMNQDIEYLIRFQNTGTDTAFRIEVVDILPEGFDVNSLKVINSSHPFSIKLIGERGFKFVFDPIALPDSNINEPASHGFIAFRISPLKDLPFGTYLDNRAHIYFDFNSSVSTNTESIVITELTNATEIKENLLFSYFPNPTKGELNIKLPEYKYQNYILKVSDVFGKELIKESWNASSLYINLKPSILPGIYFISVEDESGRKGYGKFVVD